MACTTVVILFGNGVALLVIEHLRQNPDHILLPSLKHDLVMRGIWADVGGWEGSSEGYQKLVIDRGKPRGRHQDLLL
jgi:hypothetical protein